MIEKYIIFSSLGLFFVCAGLESWFSWKFLSALQVDYPDLWEHSGHRTWRTDANLQKAWPTISYLLKRKYRERNIPEEIQFCESFRMKMVLTWFLCWLSLLPMVIVVISFYV